MPGNDEDPNGSCDGGDARRSGRDKLAPCPTLVRRLPASSQHSIDAGEPEESRLAEMAVRDVCEQTAVIPVEQQIGETVPRRLVRHGASSSSVSAMRFSPRRIQLLTVPSGTWSRWAIWVCDRSSK